MRESFDGLFLGMGAAVVLVYLILVINFQSWVDPLIVLSAVPFTAAGVIWMLFLTRTHLSVPALMGSLMCIGLTSANSILVVTFANQRMEEGDDKATAAIIAGFTRLRPVFMTAGAMILGHDTNGFGNRRGRRAERASGARGDRRAAVRHSGDAGVRSRRLPNAAPGRPNRARLLPPRGGGRFARMKPLCKLGSR